MTRSRPFVRGLLVTFLLAGLLAEILMPTLASVRAAPQIQGVTHIVISQVYGGGGNSGATYKNDFIELYNPSASSVDVTGWSVQYASSAGDTWQKTDLSGVIQPGKYYLIQEAAGSGGSVDLPTPDATGSIHMATDTGKAALVNNSTILNVACPSGLVDFVGYGSGANCFEGTNPTGTLSNTTAALRKSNGATDTDDNAADFTVGIPNPRNSSTQLLLISEVAWAGTAANTDHEWIELHNPGSQAINLSGWKLNAADGTPNIALNGTVPAMGYFLLERDEDAVSDIVADQLYSDNTLSNSGESLMLYDNNDVLIDTANANGGSWPAGDLSAHATMERIGLLPDSDSSWFTNNGVLKNGKDANGNPILGTPKSGNSPTPTPTPVPPTATFTLAPTFTSTLAFSSDEWIELYNPGAQPIDLSGWKLYATDGSPTINLTGTILAGGYFVLASSSSVFDDLTPQQTFSGSLNNAG
ncbi:MAG: lamin tail domain-containing protein, partial [Chloroflexi bacterium]|nr:lamin tail domain-containing protein [Chloroflexota bacterium]